MVSIITIRFFVLRSPKEYQRNKVPIITTRSLVLRCEARVKYSSNYDHCRFHVSAQPQFKILLVFLFNCRFWRKFRPARIVLTRWIFSVLGNLFFTVLSYFVDWIKMKSKFMKHFNRTKAEIIFFTFWQFQFYFYSGRFILLRKNFKTFVLLNTY